MKATVTARHFKAHETLVDYAQARMDHLEKFFDGIISGETILSFEKSLNSVKHATVNVHVYGHELTAEGRAEDFHKSIDQAVEKLEIQLKKYKEKLRAKDRAKVRTVREKV
jgi:putative sigma-54 modulation protein